jgi:hypothetical protein
MGSASSRNVADVALEAISTVATNISTRSDLTSAASQIISVRNVGDVIISDVIQRIEVQVDIAAMMDAMSDTRAQQDLIQSMTQSSKSLVSGINLFQFASATNEMKQYMSAVLNISTDIELHCDSLSNTSQSIIVEQARGRVEITNVTQESIVGMLSQCTQETISKTESVQTMQQTLDQSASAEAQGIDPIAALITAIVCFAVFVLAMSFGGVAIVNKTFTFIFFIMFGVGCGLLAGYFLSKEIWMRVKPYSTMIKPTATCGGVIAESRDDLYNPGQAGAICLANPECQAFDWESLRILRDGSVEFLERPLTRFYSSTNRNPCEEVMSLNNKQSIVFEPEFWTFEKDDPLPDLNSTFVHVGDVAVNTYTLKMWIMTDKGSGAVWQERDGQLTEEPIEFKRDLYIEADRPTGGIGSTGDLWLAVSNPSKWRLLEKSSTGTWTVLRDEITGTGYSVRSGCENLLDNAVGGEPGSQFPEGPDDVADPDDENVDYETIADYCTNISGFKDPGGNLPMLVSACVLIGISLLGMIYMIIKWALLARAQKKNDQNNNKTDKNDKNEKKPTVFQRLKSMLPGRKKGDKEKKTSSDQPKSSEPSSKLRSD